MGRRKKLTETELENTQTALTIENTHQSESEEAELLAEVDAEAAVDSEETILTAEESLVEEEVIPTPKKTRKPRAQKPKEEPKEVKEEKGESSQPQQDPWAAIQLLSDSVQKLVEQKQSSTHVQEPSLLPPPRLDLDTHELLRPPSQQKSNLFVTKFAVAASIVAVLISLVSLALSQSARKAAVGASQIAQQSSPSLGITRGTRRR